MAVNVLTDVSPADDIAAAYDPVEPLKSSAHPHN